MKRKETIYHVDMMLSSILANTEDINVTENKIADVIEFVSENFSITKEQLRALDTDSLLAAIKELEDYTNSNLLKGMMQVEYVKENIMNLKAERTSKSRELF